MKIAFIIKNQKEMSIGECLSSAEVFSVYDQAIRSFYTLEPPVLEEDGRKAASLASFLKEKGVHVVVGGDLGPKAKAAIEENDMHWYLAEENMVNERIINLILKKINHD